MNLDIKYKFNGLKLIKLIIDILLPIFNYIYILRIHPLNINLNNII